MATFVLVHGSWHGAWCWERLLPLLTRRGHRAVALDLPGHGEDRTPHYRATLASYARRVRDVAREVDGRPLLVGHSMGGAAITRAAAEEPELASALVYLCAFVPRAGESLAGLARQDRDSALPASARVRPTGVRIRPERAREVFYNCCSEEDAARATARLRPDPWRPLFQRFGVEPRRELPRAYVECTEDRAVSLARQRAMAARVGMARTITMECDHSPFLSAAEELAEHLDALAALAS